MHHRTQPRQPNLGAAAWAGIALGTVVAGALTLACIVFYRMTKM